MHVFMEEKAMKRSQRVVMMSLVLMSLVCAVGFGVAAQDISHPATTRDAGVAKHEVETTHIQNAEVMHVSNHQIVVRLENGKLELLNVPEDTKFQIGGNELTIHELKPGTKLMQELHTVTTPQEVTTLRTVKGKVFKVSGPHLILRFPDNTTKSYTVPDGIVFHINGEDKTVFDLREGMEIDASVTTVAPQHVVSQHTVVTGEAPKASAVAFEGPLLLEAPTRLSMPPLVASAEPPAATELPKTASPVPLMGLLGLVSVTGYGLLRVAGRTTSR
jgi:hypothetical protein